MRLNSRSVPAFIAAMFTLASGAASAGITVYNSQATFAAAVSSPGVDTFAGLSISAATPSPMTRSAGAYTYVARAPNTFFGAGTVGDPWLSTNTATDAITFDTFAPGISAIGGRFFGSNISGQFASGDITLVATDSGGAISTQTITGATTSSFLGFVSDVQLVSLTVTTVQPVSGFLWPTVDDLTLAVSAPLPDDIFLNGFE